VPLVAQTLAPQEKSQGRSIERGMTKEQIIATAGEDAILASLSSGLAINTAPNPHPEFDKYVLILFPKDGLLNVAAYKKPRSDNFSENRTRLES